MTNAPLVTFFALPLAACASTGDYSGAAPVAPVTSAPIADMTWPTDPFIVTAPKPAGAMTPYYITPTPGDGSVVQPSVLPPLRRY